MAMPKHSRPQITRLLIQSFFLLLGFAILLLVIIGGKKAIHSACPYAVVCFGLSPAQFLRLSMQLFGSGLLLGLLILISNLYIGRKFCSYICPLGSVQEALFQLRKRKYRLQHKVPLYMESKFGKLRYLILAVTVILAGTGLAYFYIQLCPIYGLSRLPALASGALIVIGISLLGAFFTERFWCRFICPFAALMNISQAVGKLFGIRRRLIRRNLERCNECRVCCLYCPMNINLLEEEYVTSLNCIGCGLCAEKCPRPGTIGECRETL